MKLYLAYTRHGEKVHLTLNGEQSLCGLKLAGLTLNYHTREPVVFASHWETRMLCKPCKWRQAEA